MSPAEKYAGLYLRALELAEDPWGEMAGTARTAALMPDWRRTAALHGAAGLWGAVLGTALWWSYAFAIADGPALALAQMP